MCKLCGNAAMDSEIRSGTPLRAAARTFNVSRIGVWRHARECLKVRWSATAEAKALRRAKHAKLEGRLEDALKEIEAMIEKAAEMNTRDFLSLQKQRTRILSMMQRQQGKLPLERGAVW
jgi:hypothetical protein